MASCVVVGSILVMILCISVGEGAPPALTLTVVNNCNFTVWPGIQANEGQEVLARGGFRLETLSHHSFPAPATPWSGRIWARTGCSYSNSGGHFSCVTGDCGGRLECGGAGGSLPTTLAQFSLRRGGVSSYGVSLVDGFNVPMTVTPHEGLGACPVVGCRENLLESCPQGLRAPLGCRSGCDALGTDQLCCRNHFSSPLTCRSSNYSDFYKRACPTTLTYAHDNAAFMYECVSPRELKLIFCH